MVEALTAYEGDDSASTVAVDENPDVGQSVFRDPSVVSAEVLANELSDGEAALSGVVCEAVESPKLTVLGGTIEKTVVVPFSVEVSAVIVPTSFSLEVPTVVNVGEAVVSSKEGVAFLTAALKISSNRLA